MKGAYVNEVCDPSSERRSNVLCGDTARGARHMTTVSFISVAGTPPTPSNTHESEGVGARLWPRTISGVPPAVMASTGSTDETTGTLRALYAKYEADVSEKLSPSMLAAICTSPRGSEAGTAQLTLEELTNEAGVSWLPSVSRKAHFSVSTGAKPRPASVTFGGLRASPKRGEADDTSGG